MFSAGEDTYYPDTKGERLVIPQLRSLLVIGIGKMPDTLRDSLQHKLTTITDATKRSEFTQILINSNPSFYAVRLQNEIITKFIIGKKQYDRYMEALGNSAYNFFSGYYSLLRGVHLAMYAANTPLVEGDNSLIQAEPPTIAISEP